MASRARISPPSTRSAKARPARRAPGRYHHGDLRRALIEEAVLTIQQQGVEGLTLRSVAERLGVSRTALYRHYRDKGALLAAVAREGFRAFGDTLAEAFAAPGGGPAGFQAMGRAYVRFAVTHPAHYRVMFGGFLDACNRDPELVAEAERSFAALTGAIVGLQRAGLLCPDDPARLARHVWAVSHGVAMLAIDGQLRGADPDEEMQYAIDRMLTRIRKM